MTESPPHLLPTLVINAGGASRRMGQPKALLPVPPDATPLLVHVARRLRALVEAEIIIVANDPELAARFAMEPPPRIVADRYPDTGTLGGIATGLHALTSPGWALVMACDLPLVSASLCAALIALAQETDAEGDRWDAVVPLVGGFAEPLHALYHQRCLPFIEARLEAGERRVISFMPRCASALCG